MKYRNLGQSEIPASVVAFGAWAIGGWMWGGVEEDGAIRAIHAAIDAGINFIDTAPVYGFGRSEQIVGKAIADRRAEVVLASKAGLVWHTAEGEGPWETDDPISGEHYRVCRSLAPENIRYEIEQSLARLATDYIDLYQTHWQENSTPIADTMGELVRLKEEGKIRAIGVSNATAEQIDAYRAVGPVDSDQELYSMLRSDRNDDLLPYCAKNDIAFLAYSPLAQGLLTGEVSADRVFPESDMRSGKRDFSVENRERILSMMDTFRPIVESHNATLAQLTIAWTVHQHGCSHALVGARNEKQATENAAGGAIDLTPDELKTMDAAIREYRAGS